MYFYSSQLRSPSAARVRFRILFVVVVAHMASKNEKKRPWTSRTASGHILRRYAVLKRGQEVIVTLKGQHTFQLSAATKEVAQKDLRFLEPFFVEWTVLVKRRCCVNSCKTYLFECATIALQPACDTYLDRLYFVWWNYTFTESSQDLVDGASAETRRRWYYPVATLANTNPDLASRTHSLTRH